MKLRVFVAIKPALRFENVNDEFLKRLKDRVQLVLLETDASSDEEINAELSRADVLITGWGSPKITAEMIEAATSLKLVIHAQGSVKSLPYEAILRRGIPFVNSAHAYARTMVDSTIGMMLSLGYHAAYSHNRFTHHQDASFDRHQVLGIGLDGKNVGIVGIGPVGSQVALALQAFHTNVFAYDPYSDGQESVTMVPTLDKLFDVCQIVTIHCGWTKETEGMVTESHLLRLTPDGMLVNNARMPIVDEDALCRLVKEQKIHAALNLIPLRKDLWLDASLADLPNLLLTNGSANVSDTWYSQVSRNVTEQLINFLEEREVYPKLTLERIRTAT